MCVCVCVCVCVCLLYFNGLNSAFGEWKHKNIAGLQVQVTVMATSHAEKSMKISEISRDSRSSHEIWAFS